MRALDPLVRGNGARPARQLVPRGEAELYEDFAKHVPMTIITALLDFGSEPELWEWTDALIYERLDEGGDAAVAAAAAGLRVLACVVEVVAERTPAHAERDDLVSVMLRAEPGRSARDRGRGDRLSRSCC